MPSLEKTQKQLARAWLRAAVPGSDQRTGLVTFVATANGRLIRIAAAEDGLFDPDACVMHRCVVDLARLLAARLHDAAPGGAVVTLEVWDVLHELQSFGRISAADIDAPAETATQILVRQIVVDQCVRFATEFLMDSRLAGWRCLAQCSRCRRYFVQEERSAVYCGRACRQAASRLPKVNDRSRPAQGLQT